MDVVTAFLNGKVTSEIHVNQLLGSVKDNKRVYKLNRVWIKGKSKSVV